jgi:hypothetical protein
MLFGLLLAVVTIAVGAPSSTAQNAVGAQRTKLILAAGAWATAAQTHIGVGRVRQLGQASATGVAAETGGDWLGTARSKVPSDWGEGGPIRSGEGTKWQDPNYQGNSIRIDRGNPNNSQISQQGDHVVINSGGRIIGRDGKPLPGPLSKNWEMGHIPLQEWENWSSWNTP